MSLDAFESPFSKALRETFTVTVLDPDELSPEEFERFVYKSFDEAMTRMMHRLIEETGGR